MICEDVPGNSYWQNWCRKLLQWLPFSAARKWDLSPISSLLTAVNLYRRLSWLEFYIPWRTIFIAVLCSSPQLARCTRASYAGHCQLLCGLLLVHVGEKENGLMLLLNQALGGFWLRLDTNNQVPADLTSEVSNVDFSSPCLFPLEFLICGPVILPLQLFELAVLFLMKRSLVACWKRLHLEKWTFTEEMKVATNILSAVHNI